jgi:hypothetical protein
VHFIRRIGGKTAGGFTLRIGFDFRPAVEYIYSTSNPKNPAHISPVENPLFFIGFCIGKFPEIQTTSNIQRLPSCCRPVLFAYAKPIESADVWNSDHDEGKNNNNKFKKVVDI